MTISCVDLFCGAGGLTYGFQQAGIDVHAGVDLDDNCRFAYERNNNAFFLQHDVTHLQGEYVKHLLGDAHIRVLAGCAPCQPFSAMSSRYDIKRNDDWNLLSAVGKIVKQVRPEVVFVENVSRVKKHTVLSDFKEMLHSYHYQVTEQAVLFEELGLPQHSRRYLMIACRINGQIELPEKVDVAATVSDIIADLPPIAAGESDPADPLHRSAKLSDKNLQRIRASVPGGTWNDWPDELLLDCHRKESGSTFSSVYGRMEWDKPSPTITTQFDSYGSGRFGHPEQDRALSLREGALLQGFPQEYEFFPSIKKFNKTEVRMLIGNAVPPPIGKLVGEQIVRHFE